MDKDIVSVKVDVITPSSVVVLVDDDIQYIEKQRFTTKIPKVGESLYALIEKSKDEVTLLPINESSFVKAEVLFLDDNSATVLAEGQSKSFPIDLNKFESTPEVGQEIMVYVYRIKNYDANSPNKSDKLFKSDKLPKFILPMDNILIYVKGSMQQLSSNVTNDNSKTSSNSQDDKLANDKLTNDKLTNDKLTNDKLDDDTQEDETLGDDDKSIEPMTTVYAQVEEVSSVVIMLIDNVRFAIDMYEFGNKRPIVGDKLKVCKSTYGKWHLIANISQNKRDENAKGKIQFADILKFSEKGNIVAVKNLISINADLTIFDQNIWNCLHLASKGNQVEMVKLLLSNGVEINSKTKEGYTALHIAVAGLHIDVIKILMEAGISMNIQDNMGDTALHIAVNMNSLKVVKLLVENGALTTLMNNKLKMPIMIAMEKNYNSIKKYLSK